MYRVLSCLTVEHDLRLVVLAGALCFLASLTAINLFKRARAGRGRARTTWILTAGAATGCGIWATHFIAMLAYEPGVATAYHVGLTVSSLLVAVAVTSIGFGIAVHGQARWNAPLGGGIVGGGIACMHYLGMAALELPGHMAWAPDLVVVSVVLGILLGAGATVVAVRRDHVRGMLLAAVLLTLAIVSHHFTAMGAVEILADPTRTIAALSLAPATLALAIAGVTAVMLAISLVSTIVDERFNDQRLQLDTALNNMRQGLLMFDQDSRVILLNQRYLQMYGLSAEHAKAGCLLRDLLQQRKAAGTFNGDPDKYIASLVDGGKVETKVVKLPDGRIISVANQTVAGGGWVSTHDDITAQTQAAEELAHTKTFLDTAINNMHQGLLMFDASDRLVLVNQRYLQMYGLVLGSLKPGCTLLELWRLRKAAGTFKGDPDQYAAERVDQVGKFRGEPGTAAFVEKGIESKVIELPDGRSIAVTNRVMSDGGWVATHTDITETTRAAKELQSTKTFLDTVVENVPATLIVKQARDRRYVLINRAGEQLIGVPRERLIGKTAHDFFPKAVADVMVMHDDEVLRSGQQLLIENNEVQTPDGIQRLVTTKRLAIHDDAGEPQYLLSVIEDVTERRRAAERIAHLAHHDTLTDLPNRAAFSEHLASTLEQADKSNGSFAVLCIDLDRFKEVNDVFGHTTGDALLREAARRLQAASDGAFLARLGGDEFTVIAADGPQPATAEGLADRLLATVAEDLDIDGSRLRVGLSIGVAIFPSDGTDAATLVSNADAALYRAKSEGRGTIRFFEADMDKRLRERRALQHELRSALAHGELTLHYQPQARIGGEIIGFEALVRWHNPNRGVIPPATFIPLAEAGGLIMPIGEWILREACREAASWPKPLQIAINLSPIQFRHGDLPALVHTILLETGLPASRLELEITEGVLIDDFSRALSILRRLKALGVRIAMDDFGTGYSSLSYLQSFPFDKIKIDQGFIANLEHSPQSATIIRAVIGLGRGLDLPVVAEGVETSEQLAFLSREFCNEVQGYLIGRPLTIENYDEIVGRRREAGTPRLRLAG